MRFTRCTALLISFVMALSLALPAYAAEGDDWLIPKVNDAPSFTDTAGIWCESEVETVYEAGLMDGRSSTRFAAADPLSNAQVMVVAARVYTALAHASPLPEAQPGQAWYQPAYDRLSALADTGSRLMSLSDLQESANEPCTRSAFANLLLLALEGSGTALPVRNNLTAAVPDLHPDSEIYTLYRAGILTGTDAYGTFHAGGTLNRGQAAAMLARLVNPEERKSLSLKPFALCADVLGLEADSQAIAITYGDAARELSMDIVAPTLCEKLLEQYNRMLCDGVSANWLDHVLPDTIEALKKDVAIDVLAQQQGITVTAEELTEEYGTLLPGYRGMSVAAQTWENTHNLLLSKLHQRYNETYGAEVVAPSPGAPSVGGEHLESDLQKLMDQMTAQTAPELAQLDLSAAQMRYVQSPIYSA